MNTHVTRGLAVLGLTLAALGLARAQSEEAVFPGKVQTEAIPAEFKDPETGLRMLHLSRLPTNYAGVVYFTYNTFSADSRLALIDTQFKNKWRYLYTFDFGTQTLRPLVTKHLTQNQVVVEKSGNVYYQAENAAWVVPLAGGEPRKLCDLPERWAPGIGFTVNADETLLLGGSTDTELAEVAKLPVEKVRHGRNVLFTVNLKSGELKVVHEGNDWFGHVQFSPTDPDLCMFCHEGNWERVERIWFINPSKSVVGADGKVRSNARVAYHRTEPREIAGHEFWRPDGKTIWFQQSFRGRAEPGFYLVSMDVETGKTTQYTIPEGYRGVHQSFSPDGRFLVSDGSGGKKGAVNEKWLSLLTFPEDGTHAFKAVHLASLAANDYKVEPNPHVSPDGRWVIFTAMLHGTPQAYAVEVPEGLLPKKGQAN